MILMGNYVREDCDDVNIVRMVEIFINVMMVMMMMLIMMYDNDDDMDSIYLST